MFKKLLLASLASLTLVGAARADKVGQEMPEMQLEGLAQSPASSMEEFSGRLLLIEFFAYW